MPAASRPGAERGAGQPPPGRPKAGDGPSGAAQTRSAERGAGIFAALKQSAVSFLVIGHTRLELLGNEFETQKLLLLRILLLTQALAFCAVLGVLSVIALVTLVLWEQRIAVLGVVVLLFLGGGSLLYRALMRCLDESTPAFPATVAELKEDIRRLKAAVGHETQPE